MSNNYTEGLPSRNWLDFLKHNPFPNAFPNEKAQRKYQVELIREAQVLIEDGKVGLALDKICLGFHIDKDYFLINLKKSGLLRHSSYLQKRNPLPGIADYLLKADDYFKWTLSEKDYWQSLILWEAFYKEMNAIMNYIDTELHKFPKEFFVQGNMGVSRLKALLVRNDAAFLTMKRPDRLGEDLTSFDFYSKEEISEAVSMLISRYAERIGIKDGDLSLVESNYAAGESCTKLITEACRLRSFAEMEIDIESFGFTCKKEGKKYLVDHPDANFSKSIDISNILYNLQHQANFFHTLWRNPGAVSIIEFADQIKQRVPEVFKLLHEPYSRFTLQLPNPVITGFLKEQMQFFREELVMMQDIGVELLIPFENMEKYELRPGLSFDDFLRLTRYFTLQSVIMGQYLRDQLGKVPDAWIDQSLVARVDYEVLVDAMTDIATKEKIEIYLDMVSWKTTDTKKFLDLQYKPILRFGKSCYIPLNTMGMSNLPRNVFASESRNNNNIKGIQMANHSGIPDVLTRMFSKHGFLTAREVPVHFQGTNQKEGDIDFLAFKDGVLFIAECKDALHPTDTFELRSTWNHVQKAASQLKYLMEALNTPAYADPFFTSQGIDPSEIKTIRPAIVMSNNKFWGYTIDGFPIRDIRILNGFFLGGKRNMRMEEKVAKFRMWKNEKFEVGDLLHFLDDNGPHEPNFICCNEREFRYGQNLYRKTYTVLIDKVYEMMKQRYPFDMEKVPEVGDTIEEEGEEDEAQA